MLQIFSKFLNRPSTELVNTIVRQVAEQSIEGVCQLVAASVSEMSLPEARGYVRARAAKIVRRHTRKTMSRQPVAVQELHSEVARAATEKILPAVLRRTGVGLPRPVKLPMAA